ncbi:MFS transporter [Rhizobium halophytocola]|uniref:MFS family permease n=1 Tax=Rhizobium halophytocola TaxID=735519 RepID=A0ABS4E5T0_9HYPH|nr:MFS transporter [Rhizobium halophytocola]MBP1853305.1 MFS family permease [Rhizobium halophytocola]
MDQGAAGRKADDPASTGRTSAGQRLGADYWKLLLSSGMTNLADGIGLVAWPWLASLITRDPLAIALVGVAQRLPWFILSLPAGVIIDRLDRRQIVIAMDALRCLMLAVLTLAIALPGTMPPVPLAGFPVLALYGLLLFSALVTGSAEVLRDSSAGTLLPAIVPRDRLETANARMFGLEVLTNMMIGPSLAGFLLALALPLVFGLTGVAFALAGLLVFSIRGPFRATRRVTQGIDANPHADGGRGQPTVGATGFIGEAKEGLAYLFARPLLRDLALGLGCFNALENMLLIALVLYAQEVLHLGSAGYGLLLTGGAVGGLAAALVGERFIRLFGQAACLRLAVAILLLQAVVPLVLPFPEPIWLTLALFSAMGTVWNIITVSLRQRLIPAHLLGRVTSVYRLFGLGMIPLGFVLSGLTVTVTEPLVGRHAALCAPFALAAVLVALLLATLWRRLSPAAIAAFVSTAAGDEPEAAR